MFARAMKSDPDSLDRERAKCTTEFLTRAWRRVTRNVLLVSAAAFFSQLSSALLVLAGHRSGTRSVETTLNTRSNASSDTRALKDLVLAAWAWGKRLPRTRTSGSSADPPKKRPEECPHPLSARRNGGNRFMTLRHATSARVAGNESQSGSS